MHLYVIRHGQSYINLPDWDGLDADTALTPLGVQQADALAAWLPAHIPTVDAIYCSTMRRPRETAEPVARVYHQDVQFDHRLREIGNNRIDHSPYDAGDAPARSDWVAAYPIEHPFAPVTRAENGESTMHFRVRVATFVEEMIERHREQYVLAVCHGGVVDAIFDYCFGIGPWRRCAVYTYNTGISHFQYVTQPGHVSWALHSHNMIEHLTLLENALTH